MKFIAVSFILISSHSYAQYSDECIESTNPKKRAQCQKQHFEKFKNDREFTKKTPEILRAADSAFKRGLYHKAYRYYDTAQDYLPSSYGLLRRSDAAMLTYVTARTFHDGFGKATGSCLLPSRFVEVVDDTLQKGYKQAVELAKIHHYGPTVTPAYLAEIDKRISCLEAMATQYRDAKTGCVDVAKLKVCMGVKK